MTKLLITLLGALMLVGCAGDPYRIDPIATANAQWNVGELVQSREYEDEQIRSEKKWFFLGMTVDGAYLVRDESYLEYSEESWALVEDTLENRNLKNVRILHTRSEPYRMLDIHTLETEINPTGDGEYRSFYATGERHSECFFEGGRIGSGSCTSWYLSGEKMADTTFDYGDVVSTVRWFKNGGKSQEWLTCQYASCINENVWAEERNWDIDGKLVSEQTY